MPDLHCGVCTGGVRLFRDVRYGRPIVDWKHTDVPPGTQPHRPVLGRPVDEATLELLRGRKEEKVVEKAEYHPPLVAPRPARPAEVPSSAMRMYVLGGEYGWAAATFKGGALVYYQTAAGNEACVLRLRRRELGVVAVWERRGPTGKWGFVDAYTRCGARTEQVGSEQLKSFIKQRDERCPECGRSSAAHDEGECP